MPVEITYTLGARGLARLETVDPSRDPATAYRADTDQLCSILDETGEITLFNGTTISVSDSPLNGHTGVKMPVDAVDYTRAADGRIVTETFAAGLTIKQILTTLVDTYLAPWMVSVDPTMASGPVLPADLVITRMKLTDVLNRITLDAGWVWRIRPSLIFEAFVPGTKLAPYSLTSNNAKIVGAPRWRKDRGHSVNRIILEYGVGQRADSQSFTAPTGSSGSLIFYRVDYPVAQDINNPWPNELIINGVNQGPVGWGPDMLPTAWYWDAPNRRMVRDTSRPGYVPSSGDVLSVGFTRQYPDVVVVEDPTDVLPPPLGRGPVEEVQTAEDIFDKAAAQVRANALLQRYRSAPKIVTLSTREKQLVLPGDVITLNLPDRLVVGNWLITATRMVCGLDYVWTTEITCVEGMTATDSWVDQIRSRLGSGGSGGGSITATPTLIATPAASGTLENVALLNAANIFSNTGGQIMQGPLVINGHLTTQTANAHDIGTDLTKFRTVKAMELAVQRLVSEDVIATVSGDLVISPSTSLTAALSSVGTTIVVKHNSLVSGDRIVLRKPGQVEWLAVTSAHTAVAAGYQYTVTRDLDGTGPNAWVVGDAVLNTRGVGAGLIEAYSGTSLDGATGPAIAAKVRTGTGAHDLQHRLAIGNLNGTYGYVSDEYGVAMGVPTAAWVKVDPSQGVRLGHGATTFLAITPDGTVRATRLIVSGTGAALNTDPGPSDLSAWELFEVPLTIQLVNDGQVGRYVFRSGFGVNGSFARSMALPVDPTKAYRIHGWARRSSAANGLFYLGYTAFDGAGGFLGNYYVAANGYSVSTAWTRYTAACGGGTPGPFPAGTRSIALIAALNFQSTSGYMEAQDLRIEELVGETLIQDGSITTDKLTVGAVTADRIAAGAITADKIAADAITADKIAAGAVTATEIAAGAVTADKLSAGAITADSIGSGTITGAAIGISSGGSLTAGDVTLNSTGLTIGGSIAMNSGGIQIPAGGSTGTNRIEFGGGASMWSTSGTHLYFSTGLTIEGNFNINGSGSITMAGGNVNTNEINANSIALSGMPTGSGTNVVWNASTHKLQLESSSLRYKDDVASWKPVDPLAITDAAPISFVYKDGLETVLGLSAEDLHAIDPSLVNLDAEGRPDSIRQSAFNAYVLAALKALKERQ